MKAYQLEKTTDLLILAAVCLLYCVPTVLGFWALNRLQLKPDRDHLYSVADKLILTERRFSSDALAVEIYPASKRTEVLEAQQRNDGLWRSENRLDFPEAKYLEAQGDDELFIGQYDSDPAVELYLASFTAFPHPVVYALEITPQGELRPELNPLALGLLSLHAYLLNVYTILFWLSLAGLGLLAFIIYFLLKQGQRLRGFFRQLRARRL